MGSGAKTTFGTKLQYGDAAIPEKFTTVAEVKSLTLPEQTAEAIKATSHDSTAGEYIPPGIVESGEVPFTANFINDATDTAVRAKLNAVAANWQICYPNWGARTAEFTAATVTDLITSAGHLLTTGQPLRVSSSGTLPAGLSADTTYWVAWVSVDTFTMHPTNADAVAGTNTIDITTTGTGTHTLQIGMRLSFAAILDTHGWGDADAQAPDALNLSAKLKISGGITKT